MVKKVYLSLGSNMGDRETNLQRAIDLLHAPDLRIVRCSRVLETAPRDLPNQPWFLNLVLECETEIFPMILLKRLQHIEKEMGRQRRIAKGPRLIDIDIVLYGRFVIDTPALTVPHPAMTERRFVLEPLAELAPDLRHPVSRRTMRELLAATAAQPAKRTPWAPRLPS